MTDSLILRGLCPYPPPEPRTASSAAKKVRGSKKLEKALKIMAFEVLKSLKGSELARRFPKAS
jgi:hypothetical protein